MRTLRLGAQAGSSSDEKPAQRLAPLVRRLDRVRALDIVHEDEVGAVVQVLDAADVLVAANGLDADAGGGHQLGLGPGVAL